MSSFGHRTALSWQGTGSLGFDWTPCRGTCTSAGAKYGRFHTILPNLEISVTSSRHALHQQLVYGSDLLLDFVCMTFLLWSSTPAGNGGLPLHIAKIGGGPPLALAAVPGGTLAAGGIDGTGG